MAIKRPDEYVHNNPTLAIADSDNVRGGRRRVTDREELYGLVAKADQLKEGVTIVRIVSDGENGGVTSEVLLVDDANSGTSAGWELYSTGASTPGTGGGSLLTYPFSIPVTQDGAQFFPARVGMDGVLDVVIQTTYGVTRTPLPSHYRLSGDTLVFDAGASLQNGEIIEGRYYTGNSGGGRDFNNVPEVVQAAVRATGHTWQAGDLTAYATPDQQAAATADVVKGDYFDSYEQGSTTTAYRYTYCLQNDSSLGWTRLAKAI